MIEAQARKTWRADAATGKAGRALWLLALAAVAGCSSSPVEKAEARYEFLKENGGTKGEVCEAARAVQEAYLEQGAAEKWKDARLTASIDCMSAELQGRDLPYQDEPGSNGAGSVADNLEADAPGPVDGMTVSREP